MSLQRRYLGRDIMTDKPKSHVKLMALLLLESSLTYIRRFTLSTTTVPPTTSHVP